jgi:hypothetical protein
MHRYFVAAGGIVLHSCKVFVGFLAVYLVTDMDIIFSKDFCLDSMIYLLRIVACFLQARKSFVLLMCWGFLLKFFRWFLRFSRSSVQKHLYLFTVPSGMQSLAHLMMLLVWSQQVQHLPKECWENDTTWRQVQQVAYLLQAAGTEAPLSL